MSSYLHFPALSIGPEQRNPNVQDPEFQFKESLLSGSIQAKAPLSPKTETNK